MGSFAAALLFSAQNAKAEYRLSAGDVIEVAVAGVPELRQRVTVQLDGSISMPLLGTLIVAGSSPFEARAKIQSTLATKVFRQRMADGRERPIMIEFDEVAAAVVEYRPIYVSGNVTRPGEQTYRPRMTVRQAVASSGGYEVGRVSAGNASPDTMELQAEYASLWAAFAKERVQVARIKSELEDKSELDKKVLNGVPLPQETLLEVLSVEAEHLKIRQADYAREKAYLQSAAKQADEHAGVLTDQLEKEEEGTQADIQDLQRVNDMFSKGSVTINRVTEARRAVLLSSTRKLQVNSQLMQVTRNRRELSRQLEKLDDQRRINLLRELQDAGVKLSGIRAKLQGIGEKLQYPATLPIAAENGRTPEISVVRKGENGAIRFIANDDSELEPGDVVEVVMRPEQSEVAVK